MSATIEATFSSGTSIVKVPPNHQTSADSFTSWVDNQKGAGLKFPQEKLDRILKFYSKLPAEPLTQEKLDATEELYSQLPTSYAQTDAYSGVFDPLPTKALMFSSSPLRPLPASAEAFLAEIRKHDLDNDEVRLQIKSLRINLATLLIKSNLPSAQRKALLRSIKVINVKVTDPTEQNLIIAATIFSGLVIAKSPFGAFFAGALGAYFYENAYTIVPMPYVSSTEPVVFCAWINNVNAAVERILAESPQAVSDTPQRSIKLQT